MGETTGISWADMTFNPWIGCAKVSPGCKHCYAETRNDRYKQNNWGVNANRQVTSDKYWKDPIKWDLKAARDGVRRRVFCGSLCDVFEDREDLAAVRNRLGELIQWTPHLDWLLLTKRPENAFDSLRGMFPHGKTALHWPIIPDNVWVGVSVENQEYADIRIPLLLNIPSKIHFLSCEPLLGPVDLDGYLDGTKIKLDYSILGSYVDWVIVGGESGILARPMYPDWARSLRDQCTSSGVAFFMKQWGQWLPVNSAAPYSWTMIEPNQTQIFAKMGKEAAGHLLDGREYHEFPQAKV
jgi:protein gp37